MQLGSLATENENYLVGAGFIGDRADLRFSLVVEQAKELQGYSPMARLGRCYGENYSTSTEPLASRSPFEYSAESGKA